MRDQNLSCGMVAKMSKYRQRRRSLVAALHACQQAKQAERKIMKTSVLFILLAGVLTARANTLTNDHLQEKTENVELTETDLDSLISLKEERELTGELDDDEVDVESLNSKMEERGLPDDQDIDDVDLENLKSDMEERTLAGDLVVDDGGAAESQPSNVARRKLMCSRGKCAICARFRFRSTSNFFRVCVRGHRLDDGIMIYVRLGTRPRIVALKVTGTRLRHFVVPYRGALIVIYNINPKMGSFCVHFRYGTHRTGYYCRRIPPKRR